MQFKHVAAANRDLLCSMPTRSRSGAEQRDSGERGLVTGAQNWSGRYGTTPRVPLLGCDHE